MNDDNRIRSSISQATSYEEMGEFWDTHDLTEYWETTREVAVEVDMRAPRRHRVAIAGDLFKRLADESRRQGVQMETLVNLWLLERLRAMPEHQPQAATEGSADAEMEGEGEGEKVKG